MTTPYQKSSFESRITWDGVPIHTVPQSRNPLVVWVFSSEAPPFPRGGLARHIDRLARYLIHRGHRVRVVVPYPLSVGTNPDSTGPDRQNRLPYEIWDVKDLPQVLPDFLENSVVHVHDPALWESARDFSKRQGVPLIVTWHTLYGSWIRALSDIPNVHLIDEERRMIQESRHQIWVSHYLLNQARDLHGPLNFRHRVIGSGISFPEINGAHLQRGFPDVLFLGRLEPEKGIDWLFMGLFDLIGHNPDLQVVICGNGSWHRTLQQEIHTHGWQHQVHAVGMVGDEELTQYIMTAKMAVLPSRFEPFGLSALETMGSGLATILGPAPGFREFAIPGQNCVVVESPDELSRAIQWLLDSPDRRKKLAASAQNLAGPWHWSRIGSQIEYEYQWALDDNRKK